MFNSLLALKSHKLYKVKKNMNWPLMRWSSGEEPNLHHCAEVNRYFYYLPQDISLAYLSFGLIQCKVGKYPKAKQLENKKLLILKPYIKQLLRYGENEFTTMLPTIMALMENPAFVMDLDRSASIDIKDLKKLGIKTAKIKHEKVEKLKEEAAHGFW